MLKFILYVWDSLLKFWFMTLEQVKELAAKVADDYNEFIKEKIFTLTSKNKVFDKEFELWDNLKKYEELVEDLFTNGEIEDVRCKIETEGLISEGNVSYFVKYFSYPLFSDINYKFYQELLDNNKLYENF